MRIAELRKQLAKDQLAGIFVTDKINRRYLTGFTGSNGLLLVTEEKVQLFIDGRYLEQAKQQTQAVEIIEVGVGRTLAAVLKKYLVKATYGFEAQTISYQMFQQLNTILEECGGQLVATDHLIEKTRMLKDPQEINKLQKAARIADTTLQEILPLIRVGMTELELANEIDYRSKKLGSAGPAFETIVASGRRTALPHAHASQKKIAANEVIMIDFGAIYEGYYSDITRTFAFGQVSPKVKEVYQKLLAAQEKAIAAVHLTQTTGALDFVARKSLTEVELGSYFSHNLGHGLGLSCHEYPDLAPASTQTLQKNMTFTIEPGVYLPNEFGIRIEDDILLKDTGEVEVLTKFTKEWMVIDENS